MKSGNDANVTVRRLTKNDKKTIVRFMRNEGRYWPTAHIAELFGFSHKQIVRLRFHWELQLIHSKKAMTDPIYRKWYEAREKKRIADLRRAFEERSLT